MLKGPSGPCLACCRQIKELKKWKVRIDGEWDAVWLCQQCRDLRRDELERMIAWNIDHVPIPIDEPLWPSSYRMRHGNGR